MGASFLIASFLFFSSASLWRSHEQIEGESDDEQQAEGGAEGLIGCAGHEDVLVLVDADHAVADRRTVDVVPRDGACWKTTRRF